MISIRTILYLIFAASFLVLALTATAIAQEETAATISGQVTDSTGAAIVGATVTVTNSTTGVERQVQSNEDGHFVVSPLAPGTYTLTAEQSNFKKHIETGI